MFEIERGNVSRSTQRFFEKTGHSPLDLFNNVLIEEDDIRQLISENNVGAISLKKPGLIIQAYLVIVKLFDLDVMDPIRTEAVPDVKIENIENIEQVLEDDFPVFDESQAEPSDQIDLFRNDELQTESSSDADSDDWLTESDKATKKKRPGRPKKPKVDNSEKVECEFCHKFYAVKALGTHQQLKHPVDLGLPLPFKCDFCPKAYHKEHWLKSHMRSHSGKKFKCKECDFVGRTPEVITRHMGNKHPPGGVFSCDKCDFSSPRKFTLLQHIERHHAPKTIQCDLCSKMFATVKVLQLHTERVHSIAEKSCEYCGKTYKNQNLLSSHIKKVHMERKFECEICGKKFPIQSLLKKHYRVHTGEKPFQCDVCDFRTAHDYNLTAHYKTKHLGIKAFKCDICDQGFNRKRDLIKHKETKHNFLPIEGPM